MSAICAVVGADASAISHALNNVTASLSARLLIGPLESRFSDGAALAAVPGMIFCNDEVVLACDADIVNLSELTKIETGLEETVSTAALLAHLYARQGERLFEALRGAFAIVLWDRSARRLLAAVDGFGIKRLAWHRNGSSVIVSSRVDSIAAAHKMLAINPRAIVNVINYSANLAPETIFLNVQRMLPGTVLTASDCGLRFYRYWDLQYAAARNGEAALATEMEAVLEQSVAAHVAGLPAAEVGAFLSGGTDSSTIVGLMTRVQRPVSAFSIGFDEPGFNELGYAEIAARAFGARHHIHLVSPSDTLAAIPDIIGRFDEPFGNASAIPTYFCARLAAANGVRTLLAGDGGDELFGGNERYATDRLFEMYHSVPSLVRRAVIEPLLSWPVPLDVWRRGRNYVRRAHIPGVGRMLSFQFLVSHSPYEVFEGDFLGALGDYSVIDIPAGHYAHAPATDHLNRLLYVDLKITLADNDLPKVTSMTALAGLQARFPFLTRSVAEFSGRVPSNLKVKRLQKRYLFKKAFRRLLPHEIIEKQKHGFGIPVALWMKTHPGLRDLTNDTLRSQRALGRGYFRPQFVLDLLEKHDAADDTYYGDTLWTLLMLELWHRSTVDAASPQSV